MNSTHISRRTVLQSVGGGALAASAAAHAGSLAGAPLAPWTPGTLDIHHISTGRGNATLIVCPDGTSMMVDAGATYASLEYTVAPIPDGSRRPGEWIGRYAKRHLQAAGHGEIDYFVLTHFHGDHMGETTAGSPPSKDHDYLLTGVTDVEAVVPIRRYIDRCYPTYDYPIPQNDPWTDNYRKFIASQVKRGRSVERIRVGSTRQIALLHKPRSYPDFVVRNLAANGEVWTGVNEESRHLFPEIASLKPADYPSENMCSLALRLSYGPFDYFTGGDLTCGTQYGEAPWQDIETPVAQIAGPVEVAVMDHHGVTGASGPGFIRALRPRVFVLFAWDSAHPCMDTLNAMMGTRLNTGPRDIFSTAMKRETRIANRQVADMKSQNGHVVVRVAPGGKTYHVFITDNADESDRVIAQFGPYTCA